MNGILALNKQCGMSSSDAVCRVKRIFGEGKCGHFGTLDPLASGVLLIGIGKAARLFEYLQSKSKRYRAVFYFGKTTDTLDRGGVVVKEMPFDADENDVKLALRSFIGDIMQLPPDYSALKVGGRKACDAARRGGEKLELAERKVTVHSFDLIKRVDANSFEFEIFCGGGTYIRALARDLAESIGTCGYMTALERTDCGGVDISECYDLDRLQSVRAEGGDLSDALIPAEDFALRFYPALDIGIHRKTATLSGLPTTLESHAKDGIYNLYCGGEYVGIATVIGDEAKLKTRIV